MLTDIFYKGGRNGVIYSTVGNWNPFAGGTDEGAPVGSNVYHSEPRQGDYRLDNFLGGYRNNSVVTS